MRILAAFTAAVVAIVVVSAMTLVGIRLRDVAYGLVTHTYEVREAVDRVLLLASSAETSERGFLLTGREEYLTPFEAAVRELPSAIDLLAALIADNPRQRVRVREVRDLAEAKMLEMRGNIAAKRKGNAPFIEAASQPNMEQLRSSLAAMAAEESQLLKERRDAWSRQGLRSILVSIAGALVLLLLATAAALAVRGDVRRREEAAQQRALVYEYQERLTGIVGHDVRSPLSAILVSARSLLNRQGLDQGQQQALERIVRSASRIESLTGLLIDFTQARLGRGLPTSCNPMDARSVVERAVDELRAAHPDRTIVIDGASQNTSGVWDGDRIAQLVSNLVSNAIRYGRRDTPVTVTLADAPHDCLEIRVHNHGPPIPPQDIPRMFEPYQRGDGADESFKRGLGLGLYIVREIARAHGGSVETRSEAREGTTFAVRLPRRPGEPLAAQGKSATGGRAIRTARASRV